MTPHLMTLNAGSSSIKFSLVEAGGAGLVTRGSGEIEGLGGGGKPRLRVRLEGGASPDQSDLTPAEARDHEAALATILAWLGRIPRRAIAAIGHRVVHGGPNYDAPVLVDDTVLAALAALEPWAPLHQPHNVAGIRAARAAFPGAPQVACFDTAFHRGQPSNATPMGCRARSMTRACGATVSTASPMTMSRAGSPRSRRRRRPGG